MQPRSGWLSSLGSCWVFSAAILWKFALIAACALPPPANDGFFFDGAVINWLRHGGYFNPSIVRMFPICGGELFSAYPPFYQAVLLPWMAVFGTSAQASLWLHGVLFALFALLALAVLRRLGAPPIAVNLGGCFLFALTFHDRPDSVAHVVGLLALWAWLQADTSEPAARRWRWIAAALATLTFATSVHIGAMYGAMLWVLGLVQRKRRPWPAPPLLAAVLVPAMLAVAVVWLWPKAWQGFSENLLATPSFTGYRTPDLDALLKIGRTTSGLMVVGAAAAVLARRARRQPGPALGDQQAREWLVGVGGPALFAVAAPLFVVAPNYITVAAYPQVLVVALFAWLGVPQSGADPIGRRWRAALAACALLAAIRAIGLSTWGVACAVDVSQGEATTRVRHAIDQLPAGSEALVSSAYLYDLADEQRVICRHADWVGRFGVGPGAFRPACLILTPYDYYRRYQRALAELAARGAVTVTGVDHRVRIPPPDSFPRLQRVVQHLSWAPVIVRVEWH